MSMILHPDRGSSCHFLLALMFLFPLTQAVSAAVEPGTSLSEEQKAEHVLNRLGYGPRPGDIERVRKHGVQAYIEQQLNPGKINDSALAGRQSAFASRGPGYIEQLEPGEDQPAH